jgi:hypothetical protein
VKVVVNFFENFWKYTNIKKFTHNRICFIYIKEYFCSRVKDHTGSIYKIKLDFTKRVHHFDGKIFAGWTVAQFSWSSNKFNAFKLRIL